MTNYQFLIFLAACGPTMQEAENEAKEYSSLHYKDKNLVGPECTDIKTGISDGLLCSFSYNKGEDVVVKQLSCTDRFCSEMDEAVVAASKYRDHSGGISTSEFLMWHMLTSSGRTDYSYSDWHRSTPPVYRTYYSPTHTVTHSPSYTPKKYTASKSLTTSPSSRSSATSKPTSKPTVITGFGGKTSGSSSRSSGFRPGSSRRR